MAEEIKGMLKMKKEWLFVVLCVSIILSAFVFRPVMASDNGETQESKEDNEIEETEERELKIDSHSDFVTVESKFENQTMENQYEIKLSTDEGLHLKLGFSSEINSTEFDLELEVFFLKLTEFTDKNGDGMLNSGEEVQTIDLTAKTYSSPTAIQTTSKDGKSGYKFESHTVNEAFLFQIIAEIFPTNANLNGTTVKPTEAKITIVIKDFPYKENGSLSLMVKATSEAEIEEEDTNSEKEIETKSATAEGYFSWLKEALVDGVPKEVKSNVTNADGEKLIALSYPNGKEIVHDPKLGITLLSTIMSFPWIYVAAGAALIALVVVIAIRAFRPRMHDLPPLRVYFAKNGS